MGRRQKSVRNCRAKDTAVKTMKLRMMTTLNDENLPTFEHQQQLQQNSGSPTQAQQPQSQAQPQQQPQVFQLQLQQWQQQQQQAQPHHQMRQPGAAAGPLGGIQIVTPTGEIYQIPIQLNAEQLQVIRSQMMGGAGSLQPIVIHTAPIQTQLAQPAQTCQTIQLQGGQHVYNI